MWGFLEEGDSARMVATCAAATSRDVHRGVRKDGMPLDVSTKTLRDALSAAPRAPLAAAAAPAFLVGHLAELGGARRTYARLTVDGATFYEVVFTLEGRDDAGRLVSATSGALLDSAGHEVAVLDATDSVMIFSPSPDELERDARLTAFVARLVGADGTVGPALAACRVPLPDALRDVSGAADDAQAFAVAFEGRRYVAKLDEDDDGGALTVFDDTFRPIGAGTLDGETPLSLQNVGDTRRWTAPSTRHRDDFQLGQAQPGAKPAAPLSRDALKALSQKR